MAQLIGALHLQLLFIFDTLYVDLQRSHDQMEDQGKDDDIEDEQETDEELLAHHDAF